MFKIIAFFIIMMVVVSYYPPHSVVYSVHHYTIMALIRGSHSDLSTRESLFSPRACPRENNLSRVGEFEFDHHFDDVNRSYMM